MRKLFKRIRHKRKMKSVERMIIREIHKMRNERVAHINSIKPLKDHLEKNKLETLNPKFKSNYSYPNIDKKFYEDLAKYRREEFEKNKHNPNLSPLPRHDTSQFNKLMMSEDLEKYKVKHPNPKFQANEKFNFIFRNKLNFQENVIYDYDEDQDDTDDNPEVF